MALSYECSGEYKGHVGKYYGSPAVLAGLNYTCPCRALSVTGGHHYIIKVWSEYRTTPHAISPKFINTAARSVQRPVLHDITPPVIIPSTRAHPAGMSRAYIWIATNNGDTLCYDEWEDREANEYMPSDRLRRPSCKFTTNR